jgi:hypothetical protein
MGNLYFKLRKLFVTLLLLNFVMGINAQTHITDAAGLKAIGDNTSGSYVLDNDIDMNGVTWAPFTFTGTLNGKGYSIKNLMVDISVTDAKAGLFSKLDGATVKNLGLTNAGIYGISWIGGLAGEAYNSTVEKCFVTGEITTTERIAGGLVGYEENSTFSQCYTAVSVQGSDHVGGIVGHLQGGSVSDCYTNSQVESTGYQVGGIVGWAQNAGTTITRCYAQGTVKAKSGFTGGILGIADGSSKVVSLTECIALQTSLETTSPDIAKTNRIIGAEDAATYSKNFALADIAITDPYKFEWTNDSKGKDGGSITLDDFKSAKFYTDSLTTWDFVNVWTLTSDGPALKWEGKAATAIATNKVLEAIDVYSNNGFVYIADAENAKISIYSLAGKLLAQKIAKTSLESFKVNGIVLVRIVSEKGTSAYKVLVK